MYHPGSCSGFSESVCTLDDFTVCFHSEDSQIHQTHNSCSTGSHTTKKYVVWQETVNVSRVSCQLQFLVVIFKFLLIYASHKNKVCQLALIFSLSPVWLFDCPAHQQSSAIVWSPLPLEGTSQEAAPVFSKEKKKTQVKTSQGQMQISLLHK